MPPYSVLCCISRFVFKLLNPWEICWLTKTCVIVGVSSIESLKRVPLMYLKAKRVHKSCSVALHKSAIGFKKIIEFDI